MLKEYEYKKALKLLDELLDKYNIPNKNLKMVLLELMV